MDDKFAAFIYRTRWTKEDGVRLRANDDEQITDPFVIRWMGGYKMYFKIEPRGKGKQPKRTEPRP